MAQHLAKENKLSVPPEQRFSRSFYDNVSKLIANISEEIVNRHIKVSMGRRNLLQYNLTYWQVSTFTSTLRILLAR